MLNDSYRLFEIIDAGGVHLLQVVKINYNFNHNTEKDLLHQLTIYHKLLSNRVFNISEGKICLKNLNGFYY